MTWRRSTREIAVKAVQWNSIDMTRNRKMLLWPVFSEGEGAELFFQIDD